MEPVLGADGIHADLLVAAFYAFTPLVEAHQEELLTALPPLAQAETVLGSVLIAAEGVNGTVCGPPSGVERLLALLRSQLPLGREVQPKVSGFLKTSDDWPRPAPPSQ